MRLVGPSCSETNPTQWIERSRLVVGCDAANIAVEHASSILPQRNGRLLVGENC